MQISRNIVIGPKSNN